MAVVSSVSTTPTNGHDGQLGDSNDNYTRTYVNEETSSIPFGIGLCRGTAGDDAKLLAAASDVLKFIGVSVFSHAYENQSESDVDGIAANQTLAVVKRGTVWVDVEETVSPGDPVYVRFATNAGTEQVGAFRNDIDSDTCVRLRGAEFLIGGTSTTPALLYLSGNEAASPAPVSIAFSHAQATADTTAQLFESPAGDYMVIDEASYYSATGLAEDATNFFTVKIVHNSKTAASWSTETTAGDGSIPSATWISLTNGTLANRTVAPGDAVTLVLDEDGSATLPAGQGNLTVRYL